MEEIRKLSHNGGAIMIDTQLMKGILEGCVLSVIAEHETYGYEILQRLTESGFTELGEGTMYPVLTRLEKNGYIRRDPTKPRAIEICRKEKSPLGPIRKYYSVTDAGTTHLKEFCESYKSITESAKKILKMEE